MTPWEQWSSQMRSLVSPYLRKRHKEHIQNQIWVEQKSVSSWQVCFVCEDRHLQKSCSKKAWTDPASCWRRARCRRPEGAGRCERGTAWEWSPVWWTPRYHRRPRPADVPGYPYEGGRQMTSAKDREHADIEAQGKNYCHTVKQMWSSFW